MKTNILNKISTLILGLSLIAYSFVIFLIVYPVKVLTVNEPIQVITGVVNSGEPLVMDINYCKFKPLVSKYSAQFIESDSGLVASIEDKFSSNVDLGCHNIKFSLDTPSNLPTGLYSVKLIIRYQVNPLREETYTFVTNKFKIVQQKSIQSKLDDIILIIKDWKLE